mmetsp:Transcript_51383/g.122312  ORF Transcript_51383/g.122312 Transcript_51383/m.122312 type:complete len:382 (-) Transcript_51383:258-1403(-)
MLRGVWFLLCAGVAQAFSPALVQHRRNPVAAPPSTSAARLGRAGAISIFCQAFDDFHGAQKGPFGPSSGGARLGARLGARNMQMPWSRSHHRGNRNKEASSSAHTPRQEPMASMPPMSDQAIVMVAWRSRLVAAGAVAGSFMAAFVIEQGGTYAILKVFQALTGTASMTELADWLVGWAATAGAGGVVLSMIVATALQLLPVFNGILLCMVVGAMWGTLAGVFVASAAATIGAVSCLLISRYGLRDIIGKYAGKNALMDAVGDSISASFGKSVLVTTMIRLSPVIPFCWSNYLFGLTPINVVPYAMGTAVGTLPGLLVFVSAGVVGKSIAGGGATPPAELLAIGALATVGAMTFLGRVSQQELAKLGKNDAEGLPTTGVSD